MYISRIKRELLVLRRQFDERCQAYDLPQLTGIHATVS